MTQDDPVPAARGMEYVYGLYYSDSEDGKYIMDQVIFVTARYHCIAITTGYSYRGILAKDEEFPDADLYLCTCVPGGEEFEIYIVVLEREQ